MTSYVTPKKGVEFIFYAGLVSQSTGQFQNNPTLAAGDFKVSIDGGALNNLATLPAVTPAASRMVKFTLSTSEMNGDNITVVGVDAAGAEWDEMIVSIQTTAQQIDDLATSAALATVQADTDNIQTRLPAALSGDGFIMADLKSIEDELTSGNNAILKLRQLQIIHPTSNAVYIEAASGEYAVRIVGDYGMQIQGNLGEAMGIIGKGSTILVEGDGVNTNIINLISAGAGKSINAPGNIAVSDGNLTLAAIAAAVWANVTRTLTAISDSAGITTLLSRITAALGIYTAADVRGAVGLTSANLDTQLTAIDDFLDTEVAAIKAKTDSLTFTVAGQVDANIQAVNDTELTGDGSSGTPWGPA